MSDPIKKRAHVHHEASTQYSEFVQEVRPEVEVERQRIVTESRPAAEISREVKVTERVAPAAVERQVNIQETMPEAVVQRPATVIQNLPGAQQIGQRTEKEILQGRTAERFESLQQTLPAEAKSGSAVVTETLPPMTIRLPDGSIEKVGAAQVQRVLDVSEVRPETRVSREKIIRESVETAEVDRNVQITESTLPAQVERPALVTQVLPAMQASQAAQTTETLAGDVAERKEFTKELLPGTESQAAFSTTERLAGLNISDKKAAGGAMASGAMASGAIASAGSTTYAGQYGSTGTAVGDLTVHILRAEGLKNTKLIPGSKQDPYLVLRMGPSYAQRFESKTVKDGGVAPYFNERFKFVLDGKDNFLDIHVKHDGALIDRPIGKVEIPVQRLLDFEGPSWVPLDNDNGQIELSASFSGSFNGQPYNRLGTAMDQQVQASV